MTPELKRMFNDRGVYIIPLDAGAELLLNELAADSNRCPQILVGNDMGGEPESELQSALQEDSLQEISVKKPLVSRLSKSLLAANNPFFADHKIGAEQVFPTVCAIAWMVEAVQSTYPGYIYSGLENYKLFKGIVFDGTQAETVIIDLSLVAETSEQLTIDVKISSTSSTGKTIFHYAATLFMLKHKKPTPSYEGALSPLVLSRETSATELYQDGTLFHGLSLQGIQAINSCDQHGLLLSCKIDSSVLAKQGEFDLKNSNVFANDLVYQALLVWVRKQLGLGSLPSSTLAWTVYSEVKVDQAFYLKLTVTEQKGSMVVADIELIDSDKQILAEIKGATVTSSASLNELFKPAKIVNSPEPINSHD